MPYIPQVDREDLATRIQLGALLGEVQSWSIGALNYIVTRLVCAWLGSTPSYSLYNQAIGVLECVKLELYRRAVSVYEDEKKAQNGEVYPRSFLEWRKQPEPEPRAEIKIATTTADDDAFN